MQTRWCFFTVLFLFLYSLTYTQALSPHLLCPSLPTYLAFHFSSPLFTLSLAFDAAANTVQQPR